MNAAALTSMRSRAPATRAASPAIDAAACILHARRRRRPAGGAQTIQALGGNGYTKEYPAGRLLRDAKLYEIGAGTNEIRRMLIGREMFARPSA